jgi:hypothetical protein
MHIEPGIVHGAKMSLAAATAAAAAGYAVKLVRDDVASHGVTSFAARGLLATVGTFFCFEVLPHFAVGVSEVHLILGTTLFLILGAAPAAIGLAAGLLIQSLFFAPTDLPMYLVNVTTLLMPLFAIDALAKRVIPRDRAYVDLRYGDVLKLSLAYQGGIVAWVAFWAIYGQGAGAENMAAVLSFGAAYMLVVVVEPLVDLAVLWVAKTRRGAMTSPFVSQRLYAA